MREILGRRRRLLSWRIGRKSDQSPSLIGAALTFATAWGWPVLPGVGIEGQSRQLLDDIAGLEGRSGPGERQGDTRGKGSRRSGKRGAKRGSRAARRSAADERPELPLTSRDAARGGRVRCACPDPECVVPGAHPLDPGLLAATTDERMVRWWWTNRPGAPVLLATGGRAPCAVSLPAAAGARALAALELAGVRLGPVVATPARYFVLVAPYSMERLGELLYAKDRVPGSLRFHGDGGYLPLPPSETGQGQVRWERGPLPGSAAPWVPDVEVVVDAVVDALTHTGVSAPEF
ncbi:bifunctional DNA primase/polymerase [Streptomyces spectabilis]